MPVLPQPLLYKQDNKMTQYKLYGRSGAGSLIVEFLLTLAKIPYDVEYAADQQGTSNTSLD